MLRFSQHFQRKQNSKNKTILWNQKPQSGKTLPRDFLLLGGPHVNFISQSQWLNGQHGCHLWTTLDFEMLLEAPQTLPHTTSHNPIDKCLIVSLLYTFILINKNSLILYKGGNWGSGSLKFVQDLTANV